MTGQGGRKDGGLTYDGLTRWFWIQSIWLN